MKFVICANGKGLVRRLSDEHWDALRSRGFSKQAIRNLEHDRSNSTLIAVIDDIQKRHPVAHEANRLRQEAISAASHEKYVRCVNAIAEFVEFCATLIEATPDDVRAMVHICIYKEDAWNLFCDSLSHELDAKSKAKIKARFEALVAIAHDSKESVIATKSAQLALSEHVRGHVFDPRTYWNLSSEDEKAAYRLDHALTFDAKEMVYRMCDNFHIQPYDERYFQASLVEYDPDANDDWDRESNCEHLLLTPYVNRDIVAAFMDANDTEGMVAYVEMLNKLVRTPNINRMCELEQLLAAKS